MEFCKIEMTVFNLVVYLHATSALNSHTLTN